MRNLAFATLLVCIAGIFLVGCAFGNAISGTPTIERPATTQKDIAQERMDIRVLQDEIKALKEQVKNLNETVYQNGQYIKELQEVYDYISEPINLPGTGEELPSDQLNN